MQETVIYHVDVNSAFLSWESVFRLKNNDPLDLRDIPSVIGGNEENRHGIVLAKSVPAKKYHIKTGEPLVRAREKCPHLLVAAPNYPLYVQSSERLLDKLRSYAPKVEPYSIDEAFCDMSGTTRLYGDPVAFAHRLKDEIRNELGFTVNIGVAPNKLLAKMASDFEKPDKVHTLFQNEIPEKMWPLDVSELFFVGHSTRQKLYEMGIHTIGQLAQTSPDILRARLKSHGEVIWNYANGRDTSSVLDRNEASKGYGNSTTIPFDVTDAETAKTILLSLCETVGARIRADRVFIKTVSVTIRDCDFRDVSHQETLYSATNVTEKIYETACRLFDRLWNHTPIRLLNVQTFQVTAEEYQQFSLFDSHNYEQLKKMNHAVDEIRRKFGEDAVKRACFLENRKSLPHMTGGIQKAKRTQSAKKDPECPD